MELYKIKRESDGLYYKRSNKFAKKGDFLSTKQFEGVWGYYHQINLCKGLVVEVFTSDKLIECELPNLLMRQLNKIVERQKNINKILSINNGDK